MSPFWKNVDEEIKYLNMNLKTLAKVSGVPYPTITNGRNRENSIPEMETARKIADALHKAFGLAFRNNEKSKYSCKFRRKIRCDSFISKIPRHYFRYGRFSRPAEGVT